MADYIASARTNRFAVKDVEALKKDLSSYGLVSGSWEAPHGADIIIEVSPDDSPAEGLVALFADGGWPSLDLDSVAERLDSDDADGLPQEHEDFMQLVSAHLMPRQVAVFIEVGSEKMRYLGGTAVAINATGETRVIDLGGIYEMASELTDQDAVVTKAEY